MISPADLREWLERRAARGYVTERREDALAIARQLGEVGLASTIGYWDGPGAPAEAAVRACRQTLADVVGLDAVVAIKAPPMLQGATAQEAAQRVAPASRDQRVIVDAPSPEHAGGAVALALALSEMGCDAGIALPGRWQRSIADAERAVEAGLWVRLVKGEHPDPSGEGPPASEGLIALARRLAGRARHVGVASHDVAVADAALGHLQARGTSCELEMLLGFPAAVSRVAVQRNVGVRVYVPWGTRAWVPYDASRAPNDTAMAWRLLSDAAAGERRWRRTLGTGTAIRRRSLR